MRFELIHLDGFGRLQGASFTLSSGLNVFFGVNEAGKSTLQQAIWALLYGFYKTDRRLQGDSEQLDRFRPWQGGAYGGYLVYRLDNGKAYRIARNFDDDDLTTSILEADTGRDVTNDYERGRLGRVAFAREQLGMSEEVFVNTCFVRQSDLHRLAHAAQAITETVVNLAGTGSQDRSVGQALESLDTALREQVGTARARTKPMAQAQDRLDRFKREREVIVERRQLLDADYDKRAHLTTDRGQIEQDLVRLRYLLAWRQQELLDGKVGEIEQRLARKAELEGGLADVNNADDSLSSQGDAVARLYQAWLSASANLERVRPDYEAAQASVSLLKQERQVLLDQQRPLEAARSIVLEHESAVRKLYQTWREAFQSARQAGESARQAKIELDELADVRARAQPVAPLLAIPQSILADLNSQWATAEAELSAAEGAFQKAHQAWHAQGISQQALEALQSRPQRLGPDTLAALRQRQATVGQLKTQARQPLLIAAAWGIAGGGLLVLVGGVMAILGVIGRAPTTVVVGGGILLFALVVLALSVAGLLFRRNREALWKAASEGLSADLKQWGSGDVATLEANNQAYITSQAPYTLWVQAQETVAGKRLALVTIEGEVRSTLRVPELANLSRADLESTVKSVEEVRGQLARLKDRDDRWKPLDQAAQLLGSDLDKATTALRDILQNNQFAGVDLDREVERFLELCENRRQLEQLEARISTFDAKLNGQAAAERNYSNIATEVENARGNLLRTLKRCDIDAEDPALGFKQFENRRDRAASTQEKRSAVQALAREVQTLLAGQTLEELKHQQAAYAREVQAWLAVCRRNSRLWQSER